MKTKAKAAFSLVEVALALGVISFALVALLGLMASTQKTAREGIDRTDSALLFQKIVNQLKLKPFAEEQKADDTHPEVFPLPSLKASTANQDFAPFVVDERYFYLGPATDPKVLQTGSKIVRVIVKNSPALDIMSMGTAMPATEGRLSLVRVEISGPSAAFDAQKMSAPNPQIFETEISPLEQ